MNNKRPRDSDRRHSGQHHYGNPGQQKKPKHDHRPEKSHHHSRDHYHDKAKPVKLPSIDYQEALDQLPPPTTTHGQVPDYTPFTVSPNFPPLPTIPDSAADLAQAPFRHKSSIPTHNRSTSAGALQTYEQLEFLGDAQIELIATRLVFSRFGGLGAGHMSQLRELLVKNETLVEFARAYGFERRVRVAGEVEAMLGDAKDRGNKGLNKVLADVFEAYVAAVILSNGDDGFAVAEKWLTALWAPKILEASKREKYHGQAAQGRLTHDDGGDPIDIYDPEAKNTLQKKLFNSALGAKLLYEPYKDSVELKGDQLGQNRHYIACYLTGYGYERKLLGKGEGRNKVEAGNWAAVRALHGENKMLVEECWGQMKKHRERRAMEKEREEAEAAAAATATEQFTK
ncbi:Ribonuclease III family [Teratosphaeria destructans]|uniref:Ribonuclease III family n=1 Tax=Teratosphaeria destructans TaxID=418781 RepID=A0A9W7W2G2_9PEZI|nr:Ribonuclease III family [Teratosphaeria destructans]